MANRATGSPGPHIHWIHHTWHPTWFQDRHQLQPPNLKPCWKNLRSTAEHSSIVDAYLHNELTMNSLRTTSFTSRTHLPYNGSNQVPLDHCNKIACCITHPPHLGTSRTITSLLRQRDLWPHYFHVYAGENGVLQCYHRPRQWWQGLDAMGNCSVPLRSDNHLWFFHHVTASKDCAIWICLWTWGKKSVHTWKFNIKFKNTLLFCLSQYWTRARNVYYICTLYVRRSLMCLSEAQGTDCWTVQT